MDDSAHIPDATEDAEFRAAVQEGLDDLAAGRWVPWEDVRRGMESWGTPDELPPPGG